MQEGQAFYCLPYFHPSLLNQLFSTNRPSKLWYSAN